SCRDYRAGGVSAIGGAGSADNMDGAPGWAGPPKTPRRTRMRTLVAVGLALLLAAPGRADEPAGKIVLETWEAASLGTPQGYQKAGYVHFSVREISSNGQTIRRARQVLHLSVKRFGDLSVMHAEKGDDTTPDGKVLGVFSSQNLGQDQKLVI